MFEILGYIFVFIIVCYVVTTIVMGCVNLFKDEENRWASINCCVSYHNSSFKFGWYLIPTIVIEKTNYINFYLKWITIDIIVSFYITTEAEDGAISKAKYEMSKND